MVFKRVNGKCQSTGQILDFVVEKFGDIVYNLPWALGAIKKEERYLEVWTHG